jgi:CDP-glucose 4,6-dehydratase
VINPQFWKHRKVFITGHTGFKGGWMSIWLSHLGAEVTGFSLPLTGSSSFFKDVSVENSITKSIYADIRNLELLKKSIQDSQPSIVIHMAAQPLVIESYLDPVETYSTNVMGTLNILESVRATTSVKAILNITTDKCYENNEHLTGYKETDPMGGYDPYSSSKACSELLSASYRRSFLTESGVALATARAGNVIGGGDWSENRILPDAVKAFMNNNKLLVRNPIAIRPWQHVLEPLRGYLILCQQLISNPIEYSSAWNFGPNESSARSVAEIVDIVVNCWGDDAGWYQGSIDNHHEANYLKLDCSKAEKELKWKSIWTLQNSIIETVKWYKASINNENMNKFTINQIEKYISNEKTF